ncbi:MAG: hypothetical protein JWN21_1055 [Sphingomonas bacterium]|uniref:CgeB family protein n=1 Tax=Sphingomonas bacterium TaxID=1895847 RepID=UPI00260B3466|nr:glycosyltransferase [Sphingomonas bacterium]MDB5695512.1 hypothetical protein [Sphingomonas bacterium]
MKIVIWGLTVSSSWGNGHATLWRGLIRSLTAQGHRVTFIEKDMPWYRDARDLRELPGGRLLIYDQWRDVLSHKRDLLDADAMIVTSYCADAIAATQLIEEAGRGVRVFYDLDTPVTLARLAAGEPVEYLPPDGLRSFDLVLSYTGGPALAALQRRLGARRVLPLYGHVDTDAHRPAPPQDIFRGDLSYLGTFADDRQNVLEQLFIEPAREAPTQRFVLGGSGYPADFPWQPNIFFMRHVAPADHPAFFCSSRLTLNVTRRDMAAMGWCPSGRLFEAAACGVPIVSDDWAGLDAFFTAGEEILLADRADEVLAALDLSDAELRRIAGAARARVMAEHSSAARAQELVALLEQASAPVPAIV